ncbi:hypothetical protein F1737_05975 [Methanoplanus sp. FWC-SCC4]|uniref:Uncharacterized protein n=1 Tax=Methanochimaera problematica TaxID=2609417 RepID=A0AA97FD13_9EURY|nr:three component ABC system middle component [Methanoplanus sp. FWC-SCC4]WOF16292.1 hypothetical protein F1737_05975 [Methanoplanus sp. FWC-SCC4]
MNELLKNIYYLYNNPFVFGKVIHTFFKSLDKKENGQLLSYLVLPLVLYPSSQQYLTQRKDSRSSLRILAKDNKRIYGLQDRISEFKQVTDITLQYGIDIGTLKIGDDLSIKVLRDWPESLNFSSKEVLTATKRLGEFMSKNDIVTNYQILGVRDL